MDVREKLVEIVERASVRTLPKNTCHTNIVMLVNALIEEGVTVQECGHWISLTECANAGVYCSVCHKKVYKEDYAWCNRKNKLRSDYCPHCGAKMTPQPPKGE